MKLYQGMVLTSALALALGSCSKDPKGPTTSNSGIKGSEWYYPVSDNKNLWEELSIVTGGRYYRTEMPAPDIANGDIENAVILVYGKLTGYDESEHPADYVGLLPTTVYRKLVLPSVDEWSVGVSSGRVSVRLQNSQNYYPGGQPDKFHSFRYIIIPKATAWVTGQKPENQNPLSRYSESELRSLSYDQICETAGLKK